MNECPHCHAQQCIPIRRKLLLGPEGSSHCHSCGLRVAVPVGRWWLVALPEISAVTGIFVVIAFGRFMSNAAFLSIEFVLSAVVLACLAFRAVWLPLRPDELSNATLVKKGRTEVLIRRRNATPPPLR